MQQQQIFLLLKILISPQRGILKEIPLKVQSRYTENELICTKVQYFFQGIAGNLRGRPP